MTELRVVVPDEIAERLASEAADRGTSAEDLAAEVLEQHAPSRHRGHRYSFIGIARAKPGALSVAEAERRLEDHRDEEFGR
ncbi:MAG: hypothetical protein ACRDVP_10790 [Acidimicrobiales bacterium]